jgi:hypothetical protein
MEDVVLQGLEIERARALHAPRHAIHSPSPNKKRKTPNDSEEDAPPKGSRRMRDLSDLSSSSAPGLSCHLPSVASSQAKMSKHTHAAPKRKHHTSDLDLPCASSRKKDRSRPLSELCNGDSWNGFTSNGHLVGLGASPPSSSSGTSTLGASLDKTCSPSKADRPKLTEVSSVNGIFSDDSPHFGPLAAASILEPGKPVLQCYGIFLVLVKCSK